MQTMLEQLTAKFWSRVEIKAPEECWPWKAFRMKNGYGTYGRELAATHSQLAHRWAWELANGPIPSGMLVLHRCDNRGCVNPGHLFFGTHRDNQRDKAHKGRHHNQLKTHCPQGHEYTPENTRILPRRDRGTSCRVCLVCQQNKKDAWRRFQEEHRK